MNIFSISILFACFSSSLCGQLLTDMRCASIVNRYSYIISLDRSRSVTIQCTALVSNTTIKPHIEVLGLEAFEIEQSTSHENMNEVTLTQKIRLKKADDSYFINARKFQCIGSYENETAQCFFQIQASFELFIDPSVSSIQHVPGGGGRAFLECPIRAPNFPPYQYQVIWTAFRNNTKSYFFTRNFTLTSYLFEPERPANMDNSIYMCSLLTNNKVTLQANISMVVLRSSESPSNMNHSSALNTASGLSLVGVFSIYGVFVYVLLRKIKSRGTENRRPCTRSRCIWPRGLASSPPSRTGIDIGPSSEIQPMTTPRTQFDFEEPVPIVCRVCRGCARPHR
jgi:hypothetical protein